MTEKKVSDSAVTQIQILMQKDLNGQNRLFGGRLFEWIDIVAMGVARRHSNCVVTTAYVDSMEFSAPAFIDETIILNGRITYAGNTSMEVRVDSFVESLSGEIRQINKAYLVLVAIGSDGKKHIVPKLKLETEEERREFEEGKQRSKDRELRRQKDKKI